MKITDENELKELTKGKKRHVYNVGDYSFQQFYKPSLDAFNPYCVFVYLNGQNVAAGSGPDIASSYDQLIISTIKFKTMYLLERNKLSTAINNIESILGGVE